MIRLGVDVLCYSLAPIVNNCLLNSTFPSDFKLAEVRPIYKKGDVMSTENYRPISILTSCSKIVESIMCDQMMLYLDSVLSPMLCAYRKNRSCVNVLLKCIENWKMALDKNHVVGSIMMDLSKAFDVIPHDLLIAKFRAYGFSADACQLLFSYLCERQQRVKLNSSHSEWQCLRKGARFHSWTSFI